MPDILIPYLAEVKRTVARNTPSSALVVLGNEAADLDSMVSAVVYACALFKSRTEGFVVPLMPIPRDDFRLRTEAVFVFRVAGVGPHHLIFEDEAADLLPATGRVALVDHNRTAPAVFGQNLPVTAILDHHRDEGLYPDAAPRRILPVGSCATLAAEEAERLFPELLSDRAAARLLLGTILLDTVNLNPDAGRTTERDAAMAGRLENAAKIDTQIYYQDIQTAKFNTAGLSTKDLLRKDFKGYETDGLRFGIASVTLSLSDWFDKDPGLTDELAAFAIRNKLDILITMNAYHAPGFSRDLAFWCANKTLYDRLATLLDRNGLKLVPLKPATLQPTQDHPNIALSHQGNLAISRKKLAPILRNQLSP